MKSFVWLLLVGVLAVAGIGIGVTVRGFSGGVAPVKGSGICQITVSAFCVITKSISLPGVPKVVTGVLNGITSDSLGLVNWNQQFFVSIGTTVFEADGGTTWVNMPAATTELYGNPNHEIVFTDIAPQCVGCGAAWLQMEASFSMTCIAGSSNNAAVLRPQFLDINSGLWTELSKSAGGLDVHADATDCAFGVSPAEATSFNFVNTDYNSSYVFSEPLRVVGINGGGVGDTVTFNNIELQFVSPLGATFSVCTPLGFRCPDTSSNLDSGLMLYFDVMGDCLSGCYTGGYPYVWVSWSASM